MKKTKTYYTFQGTLSEMVRLMSLDNAATKLRFEANQGRDIDPATMLAFLDLFDAERGREGGGVPGPEMRYREIAAAVLVAREKVARTGERLGPHYERIAKAYGLKRRRVLQIAEKYGHLVCAIGPPG